jgi:hypothetical protein
MSGEDRRSHRRPGATRGASPAKRVFGPMTAASAAAYVRSRDLPRLLPLWPSEIEDRTPAGGRHLLAKLRRALRCERRRARANHWSYDLNRHLGLLSAYKGELASLALEEPEAQLNCTRRDSGKS